MKCNFLQTRILSVFNLLKRVGFAVLFLLGANQVTQGQWTEPVPMEPHFGAAVVAPWLSNDELRLYVSGTGYLFMSRRDSIGAPWQRLQSAGDHINSGTRQESPCESPNGDTLYFMSWAREDAPSFGLYDIFYCVRTDTGWGPVHNAGENINTFDIEWSVGISRDGQFLLVSSDRLPTTGGRDIYYSERQLDGSWGPLISFGLANGIRDDDHATLSPDNNTLYMYGVGPGLGNIWVSHKIDGIWQQDTALPPPVNSITSEERDPCIAPDGRTLWFARDDADIDGYRIYTSVDTTILTVQIPSPYVNRFDLSAFPNPFNSTLSISLDVPLHQDVTLGLYDLLGREVDEVYRGRLSSSTISYVAPAALSSGVYFLRAESGKRSVLVKVALVK